MPKVDPIIFGRHKRSDGKPGYQEVTPTKMSYLEADRSDIRLSRVRVFDQSGKLVKTFLQDTMGRPFLRSTRC